MAEAENPRRQEGIGCPPSGSRRDAAADAEEAAWFPVGRRDPEAGAFSGAGETHDGNPHPAVGAVLEFVRGSGGCEDLQFETAVWEPRDAVEACPGRRQQPLSGAAVVGARGGPAGGRGT